MEKIVLIEPQSKEDHVYKHVRMPRLGLPILGTQLQEAGYRVNIYMGTGDSLPWKEILKADLVGISTTTATCREAYQVAGMLRTNAVPVVIGGIHATFLSDEALQFADYVVRGEAEYSFLPLVRAIEEGRDPCGIPGVSYWDGGKAVHNPVAESRVDMGDLPIPNLTLLDRFASMRSIPVMTSRGCPYNCNFCCVTQIFGRRYRYRSNESILEELSRYRGKNIFFCDDNFTANPERTKELMRAMIERGVRLKSWGAQVRVDAARDEELLGLMRRAGCNTVYIGFESINPATLDDLNKQQTVEDIEKAISRFHEFKIKIHGMFVFGGDSDTAEIIKQTVRFALETRIDSVQFLTLTPLPGTPLYQKLTDEDRILTADWSLYDGHHAVFQPALISAEELQTETVHALKKFYSFKNIWQNLFLTGWGSVINRAIGWAITRHFERRNRWYELLLKRRHDYHSRPVALLYRLLKAPVVKRSFPGAKPSLLKVSLIEQKGVMYLKLRGLVGGLHLKELKRTLRGLVPKHYGQVIVNTEGLRFASEKAAQSFGLYLEKMGVRVRRLQVIIAAEKQARSLLGGKRRGNRRPPRYELLFSRGQCQLK